MRSSVSVSSATTSTAIRCDDKIANFVVGFAVVITGTCTFKVQHTYDDPAASSPTWFDHATVTGKTANTDGSYTAPVRAIRLNVTAWTSGTATLTALQGVDA